MRHTRPFFTDRDVREMRDAFHGLFAAIQRDVLEGDGDAAHRYGTEEYQRDLARTPCLLPRANARSLLPQSAVIRAALEPAA